MKKITAFALALLMVLSTASYAAPVMAGTVTSTSEEEVQTPAETCEKTAQTQSETDWIDEQYGHLLYSLDFETKDAFVTGQHPSKQGYVNPDFAEDTWTLVASSSTGISTDAGYKPAKVTENGNTFLRMYSNLATNMSFQVRTNGTSDGFFTDENGYYTVFADVKAIISGNAGQNYNQFFAQAIFPASSLGTAQTAETGKWTTASGMVYKTNEPALRRISYHFGYAGKTTTKNVDVFEIDNIKLYYKPFSVDVTVAGNAQLGIADKTVTVNIGEDLDSTITKEELMAMLSYEGGTILKDLTLADGSAFTSIDVVEVQNVKGVFEQVEWLHDTYGTLLVDIDFETDTAYKSGAAISTQGISNINYDKNGKWTISTGGVSTKEGFAPAKVTENGNTFLRVYNTNNKFPQFKLNGTGKFTDELGYYTYVADVRYNFAENVDRGTDTKGNPITLNAFFIRANYSCKNDSATATGTVQTAIAPDNNIWPDNNVWLKGFTGTANKRTTDIYKDSNKVEYNYDYVQGLIYPFQYSVAPSASSEGSDYFDYDNIKLYFKPFSVKVKVDNEEITVAIPETLDSNITKASLMELVPEKEDAILVDLTLTDGTAFTSIDVMKVTEVKAVWMTKAPVSYNVSSIRVNNPAGIRFRASVTTEQKEIAAEYGFIVTLEKHLGEKDASVLTIDSDIKKVTGVSYGYDPKAEKDVDRIYEIEGNNIFFTAAVYGMPETKESYSENIVVRPYLKDADGKYHYAEPIIRSVIDVATAIRDGGYTTVDEKGKAYVQNILDICGEEI